MKARRTIPAMVLLCGVGSASCGSLYSIGNLTGLNYPPELIHVIANRSDFVQDDTSSFAKVIPGTVHDDLSGLAGCFGSAYQGNAFGLPFDGYEVYHFDPRTSEMSYVVLNGPAFAMKSGHYSIIGPDRLQFDIENPDGTVESVTTLATFKGAQLRVAFMSSDGNYLDGDPGTPDDPRVSLVFKGFTCPESN